MTYAAHPLLPHAAPYPADAPVFEIVRAVDSGLSGDVGDHFIGRIWSNHRGECRPNVTWPIEDTANGTVYAAGEVRPLTRAAREMMNEVTP